MKEKIALGLIFIIMVAYLGFLHYRDLIWMENFERKISEEVIEIEVN